MRGRKRWGSGGRRTRERERERERAFQNAFDGIWREEGRRGGRQRRE